MRTTWKLGRQRLLFLADVLDIVDKGHELTGERTYNQKKFVHPCGAPACALGHYAAQFPRRFTLKPHWQEYAIGEIHFRDNPDWTGGIGCTGKEVRKEFAISGVEAGNLFAEDGCDGASTGKEAASYIRKFVASKDRRLRAKRAKRK